MKTIWVLGNGQLGAMLKHAAIPLNLEVRPVDIAAQLAEEPPADALVTAEREHWPPSAAAETLFNHPNFISRTAFERLPDRRSQKQLLDDLKLATAPWRELDQTVTLEQLHQELGPQVLLKRRTGGYDGKGQHWLRQAEGHSIPEDWRDQAIAEQAIAFSDEASIIGVRNRAGQCEFYPLTLNLHTGGILSASIAPAARLEHLQNQAQEMLQTLMAALDYVGVMAMECFLVGETLLVNEVAPRVHNSGHWTQAGSSISQFEYHLRALADLPLAPALVKNQCVMLNLIGVDYCAQWLTVPGAEVFWYGKDVRPGRKVGHINLCGDRATLTAALQQLETLMPTSFATTAEWVRTNL